MKQEAIKELIVSYLRHNDTSRLPQFLSSVLEDEKNIIAAVKRNEALYREEYDRHESEISKLYSELKSIRDTCQHHSVTCHEDYSGLNDSYGICDICGKEVG